jgi:hypothetical protein
VDELVETPGSLLPFVLAQAALIKENAMAKATSIHTGTMCAVLFAGLVAFLAFLNELFI